MPDSCPSSRRSGRCSLTRRGRCAGKFQIRNPKFQVPSSNLQSSNRRLGTSLELGFWNLEFFPTSVNAKQLEPPVFQAGPNRCESDHGCHFVKREKLRDVLRNSRFALHDSRFTFSLSRCNEFCTPLCEGGSSWCKST